MESIEKLREMIGEKIGFDGCPNGFPAKKLLDPYDVGKLVDELEREIAESYMKLPVDADGVPIHVGDEMTDRDSIPYIVIAIGVTRVYCNDGSWVWPSDSHHVKPDIMEVETP